MRRPEQASARFRRSSSQLVRLSAASIPMAQERFSRQISELGLGKWKSELLKLAVPTIQLSASRDKSNPPPAGTSKLGGEPDLPASMPWPANQNGPLAFLAQIQLSDLPQIGYASELPESGLLSFFYDWENQPWGYDPSHGAGSQIVFIDGESQLARRTTPEELEDEGWFLECGLSPRLGDSLPTDLPDFLSQGEDPYQTFWQRIRAYFGIGAPAGLNDEEQAYYTLLDQLWSHDELGRHKLLGYPDVIQNSMELECQLASNGLYCGDATGYQDPRAEALGSGASDWQLLFQLDSCSAADMMWGDSGSLYFWIRRQDLAERRFHAAWTILQCY